MKIYKDSEDKIINLVLNSTPNYSDLNNDKSKF